MADHISSLPHSDEQVSQKDIDVMKSVFGGSAQTKGLLSCDNLKKLFLVGIVFLLINLPIIDSAMKAVFDTSDFILLLIKTILFVVIILLAQFFQMA